MYIYKLVLKPILKPPYELIEFRFKFNQRIYI